MGLFDKLFGGKDPGAGAAQPAAKPAADAGAPLGPMAAFIFGTDIEELYQIFGEQTQSRLGGLPADQYTVSLRKLDRVMQYLGTFRISKDVTDAIAPIRTRLERQGGVPTEAKAAAEARAASLTFAQQITRQMGAIRKQLDEVEGMRYDLGIFAARLSFCARVIRLHSTLGREGEKLVETYAKEITRAGNAFTGILVHGDESGALSRAFDRSYVEPFLLIITMLRDGQATKPDGARTVETTLEQVFTQAGFTGR